VSSSGVSIDTSGAVVRGQYFGVFPFFTRYERDDDARAELVYDLVITKPDGEVWFEAEDLEGHRGAAPDPRNVLLASQLVRACFEPEDELGSYRFDVTAHDLTAGTSAAYAETIELVACAPGDGFSSREELWNWMHGLFDTRDPERAVPGLLDHGEDEGTDLGFFRHVFEQNGWLIDPLLVELSERPADERELALRVLASCTTLPEDFDEQLAEPDRERFQELRSEAYDPLVDPIRGRDDVNALWGMYVAGRRFAPIERLLLALSPEETGVVADLVLTTSDGIEVPLARVVPKVVRTLLERGLAWDPHAEGYARWLHAQELPEGLWTELDTLLGE